MSNRSLKELKLQDNDIQMQGGEIIGAALRQNKTLRCLKISENELRTEGCEFIIKNSLNLSSVDLSKNFISYRAGPLLKDFLIKSSQIQYLNLEFNELLASGAELIAEGL